VKVYRIDQPVTVPGVHTFGDFNINAVQGQGSPDVTKTVTLPAGTLYIPLAQGTKHWIQAVLGENPYLPFNYFYDEVTWSYSLLRGFSGDGFLTQQMPTSASMSPINDPGQGTAPDKAAPVYAFNTDSVAGLPMVNQLLTQGATVARAATSFDVNGQHFDSGAALVDGSSIDLSTMAGDATHWETPVAALSGYPVKHYAIGMPKIAIYTGGTTVPTNPAFHGTGDGYCRTTSYCEALFDLTQKEGIPTSQIDQLTSTDLSNGVLQSGGYTVLIDPASTISATTPVGTAGTPAQAVQAFINAGGTFVGSTAGGATSARNAGVTTLNTNSISGITTPGSTFDASWDTSDPARWGMDSAAGSTGNQATFAPAGDSGGPAGFGNCYGYEIKANANLPGRPAVVDQSFGSGHAIMLGFDPWYRAWTTQEERLLNAILYPTGTAIPAGTVPSEIGKIAAHQQAAAQPVAPSQRPTTRNRPVRPSGAHLAPHNPH
jgi:hypothetical protein